MNSFDQLFDDFGTSTKEEWKEKVVKDLKGKDFSELIWEDEDGFAHNPYYDQSDLPPSLPSITKKTKAWNILQSYQLKDWEITELRAELEYAFKNGLNRAVINLTSSDDLTALKDLEGVSFFMEDGKSLDSIKNVIIDPIGSSLKKEDAMVSPTSLVSHLEEGSNYLLVDGLHYVDQGATALQEIAYILWHLTDFFDLLTEAGWSADRIAKRVIIRTSIGSSYFTQIAKFRALRWNVKRLFVHYEINEDPLIWAESNPLFLDTQSFNNNLIRLSCQAMSAVLGSSDWVSLSAQAAERNKLTFANRMSRNIQLLLKHESHLDEVEDLVKGAYYIEDLSLKLYEASWDRFAGLEKQGSLVDNSTREDFMNEIKASASERIEEYKEGNKIMVGVNKYPFEDEAEGERIVESSNTIAQKIKEGVQ